MKLRDTKFGMLKHAAVALILILACHVAIWADPVTAFLATWYGALALSAALSAASYGLQVLFQPKPKPQDKNRLQGGIQLMAVGEDIVIPEIAGAAPGDGIGGMLIGGLVFHASAIRKTVVTVSGQGGGSGGGKGGPKPPPTKEYHYFIDLAILGPNRGPYRVKQIKANTKILYQSFSPNEYLLGTTYEAEDRTGDSGAVTEAADVDCSGGLKANLDLNEYLEWNIVAADTVDSREMYIVYKSAADHDIELTVNGVTQAAVLADSFNILANVNLPQSLTVGAGNTVRIKNLTNAVLSIDRIVVGYSAIDPGDTIDTGDGCVLSGVKYVDWVNPEPTYDSDALRDPLLRDDRGCQLYNYQPNANALGEISAPITGNGNIRIYPGNKTQLPDPLLQEYFEAKYGPGSTPAFRNRCYIVLENFEITEFGTVPNITIHAEHETINSLGEYYTSLAARVGLEPDEYDFSDLNAIPLRGYAVNDRRAPGRSMEVLNRIFDVDVFQDFDGRIVGVIPDETVEVTIPAEDLDAQEGKEVEGADAKPFEPVQIVNRDESELPGFLDVSFFDPSKNFEIRNTPARLEIDDASERKANIETGLVLTEEEAQKFADRDLHKQYIEKDGLSVSTFHKYTYLQPTNKIKVVDTDGAEHGLRIKGVQGWIPGKLEIKGVSRDAIEFPPRLYALPNNSPHVPSLNPPAPVIGTFIDLAAFREEQTAGFYAAAALTDPHYQWSQAGVLRSIEGDEWEALAGIRNEATMGRTVTGADGILADAPAAPFPTPAPPVYTTSPTGGTISQAKKRQAYVTYYDGTDESFASYPTAVFTEGSTSTLTFVAPPATAGATHYRIYLSSRGNPNPVLQNGAGTAIGTDLVLTSITNVGAAPPSAWDTVSEVTVDLYNGELETLTADQVLEGRNYAVIANEIVQFQTATRDNSFPNRWVLSDLLRGVRNTLPAAIGHADEERFLLYSEAWVWVPQDPSLANITRTYKFLSSGDDLDKAWSTTWKWNGVTQFNTPVYTTVDNGVPVLDPAPPTLAIEGDFLRVFIRRPIQFGYTADRAEVRVRADSDDSVIRVQETAGTDALIIAPTVDANVDYRWQNRYRGETATAASDGWSEWSTTAFFDITTPPDPPEPTNPGGDPPGPGDLDPIGCFVDGVLVLMADWSERPIEQVRVGDFVMSWTHTGRIMPGRVARVYTNEYDERRELVTSDDSIGVTESHPFLPDWNLKVRVQDMVPDLRLRSYQKGWRFVDFVSADVVPGRVKVNNLEVAFWHSFFVRQTGESWKAVYNLSAKNQGYLV